MDNGSLKGFVKRHGGLPEPVLKHIVKGVSNFQ
jgi:hypothetical protein